MKRGGPIKRTKPMPPPKSGLRRTTPLQQSAKLAQPGARKNSRTSSLTRKAPMRMSVPRDPGPTGEVVEAVVERDRYSCIRCGYGVGPNEHGRRWSLHHRKRRSQGGEHTVQNLILLCGGSEADGCHQWVHGNPDEARDNGWLLKERWEPLAVPVFIPLEARRVYLGADGLYRDDRKAS